MICHIGLASEFKHLFSKEDQIHMYKTDPHVMGVAYPECDTTWIFIDRIAFSDEPFYRECVQIASKNKKVLELFYSTVIDSITDTTIHELIHLCGYGEDVAWFGEEAIK